MLNNIIQKMKQKKKIKSPYEVITKVLQESREKEKEISRLRCLYIETRKEQSVVENRLKMERNKAGFYASCTEFLHFALIKAKNLNSKEVENELSAYINFKQKIGKSCEDENNALRTIEVLIEGKYKTIYVD